MRIFMWHYVGKQVGELGSHTKNPHNDYDNRKGRGSKRCFTNVLRHIPLTIIMLISPF